MKEETTYSADDLNRYHSGSMPGTEMHRLEKAALDDPFLADALEGYSLTKNADGELNNLQTKLEQRISSKNSSKLRFLFPTWMRVAALFLIFIGAGWFLFKSNKTINNLATNTLPNSAPESRASTDTQNSSTGDSITTNTTAAVSPEPGQAATESVTNKQIASSKTTQSPGVTLLQQADSGAVMPSAAEPNVVAEVKDNGYSDKSLMAKSRSAQRADSSENLNIVMQKAETPELQEVVVTGNRARRQKERQNTVSVDTLETAQNAADFDEYISNNLRYPRELKTKSVSGTVELKFDIDKEGTPVNIAVTKSLCEKCDEEAVRLLKEGPKWKKKPKKGKVKIRF